MALPFLRFKSLRFASTVAIILSLVQMPVESLHAHSKKQTQNSSKEKHLTKKQEIVKLPQLKNLHNKYSKKYDDSHLRKWTDYFKKWHRKPSQHQPAPMPPGYCAKPFQKQVAAVKIQGHHIYLKIDDLAFLKTAGFQLQEAELDLVLKGRHEEQESISLSLNGLKVTHPGHKKLNELVSYFKGSDSSRTKFKLNHFFLNGAEPFNRFLVRIKKNQGLLRITLFGRHYKIVSASVLFKGISYDPCGDQDPDPNPNPNPNPEDLSKYQVKIDSVNPSQSPTASTNLSITFSSINTDGSYWCSLDQAPFEKCQSPVTYAALANGSHNFQVFATTPKGIDGAKASYSWSVDNVKPVVTITNAGILPTLTREPQISFEFSSTKAGSTFRCSLDGAVLFSCQSPMSYSIETEGLHNFSVTAVDRLGNISGAPATFQWTLDRTAPLASFISVLPSEEYSSSKSKNFSFGANETSDFECSLDQAPFIACESPISLNQLSEGMHLFSVRPTDLAGNQGAPISYSWTTDYSIPILVNQSTEPPAVLTNSQNISVQFSTSEPASVYCRLNDQPIALCSSPFVQSNLSEGPQRFVAFAVDRAGLRSSEISVEWTIDLTAPLISFGLLLPSSASAINSSSFQAQVNASENLSLLANLNGMSLSTSSQEILLESLSEGSYILDVTGVDGAGNSSNTIQHAFTVDLTAPVLNLTSEGSLISNLDYRSFNFSSNENVRFECLLDEAGFQVCQDQIMYSGLADGDHLFTLRATDDAGNVSLESFAWSQDATPPRTSQSHFINGMSITISLSSTESNVTYLCSLDGVPISPCNSSIIYNDLAAGSHTFLARAVDTLGNVDSIGASFSFVISAPIRTLITGGTPPGEIVNSNTMTISFTADQPAQGFVCSLDNAPFSSCVSAITYSGLSNGSHTVVIRAIDQFGNLDPIGATKTWIVDTQAPVVSNLTAIATANTITVSWTTSEPATSRVNYGVGSALNQNSAEDLNLTTNHTIVLTGLSSNTIHSIRVTGKDGAGNSYISTTISSRTSR